MATVILLVTTMTRVPSAPQLTLSQLGNAESSTIFIFCETKWDLKKQLAKIPEDQCMAYLPTST